MASFTPRSRRRGSSNLKLTCACSGGYPPVTWSSSSTERATGGERNEEQAMRDLRSCFLIKESEKASYHVGCHNTRDQNAGMSKEDKYQCFGITKTSTIPSAAGENRSQKEMTTEWTWTYAPDFLLRGIRGPRVVRHHNGAGPFFCSSLTPQVQR